MRGSYSLNDLTVRLASNSVHWSSIVIPFTFLLLLRALPAPTPSPVCVLLQPIACMQLLQQQPAPQPSWNHKLVSVKPKLEPVPEGGPSLMGGPLNLMPLGCTQPNSKPTTAPAGVNSQHIGLPHSGAASSGMMPINISQKQLQKRQAAALAVQGSGDSSDCQDNESTSSESMPRSYPSCNTLSAQLEMTRVRSETQLSGLAEQQQQQRQQQQHTGMVPVHGLMGGAAQGSTAAAVEAFRQSCALPAFNLMQGEQQRLAQVQA